VDARISSPASAPLERIYFLRHGSRNAVQPLSVPEAAAELMVCCFPPFYDKAGMEFTLELIGQLASEIPCQALGFVAAASGGGLYSRRAFEAGCGKFRGSGEGNLSARLSPAL